MLEFGVQPAVLRIVSKSKPFLLAAEVNAYRVE